MSLGAGMRVNSANRGDLVIELGSQGFFLRAGWLKAASTSSSLMRCAGSPRSPRFCSSVPSPIIPRWIIGRGSLAPFLASLDLRFVGHREILCVGGFGLAPATLGDHPTRPRRRVSGSESTQAIALGSARCDPKLPLLQRGGRDATIALIRDSHGPFIAPLTEGLNRRRPIRQRGKFGGRLRDLGGKELPRPPEEALRPARLASALPCGGCSR